MKLTIVIPCYNEERTIEKVLAKVQSAIPFEKEVIIVDDCSQDGTRELLETKLSDFYDKLILHEKNTGKGGALQTGFAAATGDIVAIQDADLEYDPAEIPGLVQPIIDGIADVSFGSRFRGGNASRVHHFWHMLGNRFLTLLSNMFTNLHLSDMETCYKAFRIDVLRQLELTEKRFGIEPEMTAKIAKLRVPIYEIGISYHGRSYEEGKKIGWKDGVRAIYAIVKYSPFFNRK
ncbi:glycosyltransferase family 2 protein [Pelagicoccus mobilis]|uniref:Glycosyltransferase family 2 protein n=1 Tax=Pelagicoccus mobilis TaxID=415221 RepID=A0A934RUN2_9BACT|nr:glycosyltransferase family 2 protein [Pelagicoccus mobilis]MBK1875745.1 glycosyltransferase family 2 protein [Pelagicoccus mobilis]